MQWLPSIASVANHENPISGDADGEPEYGDWEHARSECSSMSGHSKGILPW